MVGCGLMCTSHESGEVSLAYEAPERQGGHAKWSRSQVRNPGTKNMEDPSSSRRAKQRVVVRVPRTFHYRWHSMCRTVFLHTPKRTPAELKQV